MEISHQKSTAVEVGDRDLYKGQREGLTPQPYSVQKKIKNIHSLFGLQITAMIESSSPFVASSIPLSHNALKSIIFKCAELLMALFIYKLFSFVAARANQYTSYFMFAEDYMQRWLFLSSRGLSRAGLVVLLFSILNMLASLYGTLLWALDAPGYVFTASDATVADYESFRNTDPPYIVQLNLAPGNLEETEKTLEQVIGSELFNPGLNYTLTGEVQGGKAEITTPTRYDDVGARIWLDSDGFSVSPDSYVMLPGASEINGQTFPSACIHFGQGSAAWNCTFNNTFSQGMLQAVIGMPEVHWDDESDRKQNSRYIKPNRVNNIWASFGAGGGSAAMMQVFTVTKGTRRHMFLESVFRATMLTDPGVPFAAEEVGDLVRRSGSMDEPTRSDPFLSQIVEDMMHAQDQKHSYHFGVNMADNGNLTVLQSSWGYLNVVNSEGGADIFSIISLTTTNITLIRSETIDKSPVPFGKCGQGSFQNEAFGGKLKQNDCAGADLDMKSNKFFGQVDTAAVMIAYGLGNGRSNISLESLDDEAMSWIRKMSAKIATLLVARGHIVSIDPALVTINVDKLIVAMSGLQLLLSLLAALLAGFAWLTLAMFANAHWSNTFLATLVHATSDRSGKRSKPGYMHNPPDITVLGPEDRSYITISGKAVVLQDQPLLPNDPGSGWATEESLHKPGFETEVHQFYDTQEPTGRDGLLSHSGARN
jgi:hypothetical protein